jgi:hypothetical protein
MERMPDGSAVLFDPLTQMAYAVSASAALVWETCDGVCTPSEIAEHLAGVYDPPEDVITRDVDALLAHLRELGLLEAGSEAGA